MDRGPIAEIFLTRYNTVSSGSRTQNTAASSRTFIPVLIDKSFINRDEHLRFWKEWLRADLMKPSRESFKTIKQWPSDHPFRKKYQYKRDF